MRTATLAPALLLALAASASTDHYGQARQPLHLGGWYANYHPQPAPCQYYDGAVAGACRYAQFALCAYLGHLLRRNRAMPLLRTRRGKLVAQLELRSEMRSSESLPVAMRRQLRRPRLCELPSRRFVRLRPNGAGGARRAARPTADAGRSGPGAQRGQVTAGGPSAHSHGIAGRQGGAAAGAAFGRAPGSGISPGVRGRAVALAFRQAGESDRRAALDRLLQQRHVPGDGREYAAAAVSCWYGASRSSGVQFQRPTGASFGVPSGSSNWYEAPPR